MQNGRVENFVVLELERMLPGMLEIERKFRLPPHFVETLLSRGAELISQVEFEDKYFDFSDHKLTSQGCWLRKRNDRWELKVLARGPMYEQDMDSYREFDKEDEILQELSCRPSLSNEDTADTLTVKTVEEFLKANGCVTEFVCFRTFRSRYKLPRGVFVDLDQASFGYGLGELEVVVEKQEDVPLANKAITEAAEMLGITCHGHFPGKLEEYLRRYRTDHYEKLVAQGALKCPGK